MKKNIQTMLAGWKTAAIILVYFLTTLLWSRRIVRRARPASYLIDGLIVSCAFSTVLWIV